MSKVTTLDENQEWENGIELHFGRGGTFECMNCDWATNDRKIANRHRKTYDHSFWVAIIRYSEG